MIIHGRILRSAGTGTSWCGGPRKRSVVEDRIACGYPLFEPPAGRAYLTYDEMEATGHTFTAIRGRTQVGRKSVNCPGCIVELERLRVR